MTTNRDNAFRLARDESSNDTLHFTGNASSLNAISANQVAMNTITFNTANEPILELKPNGNIFVQGRLAANDLEVVDALRLFLGAQGLI